MQHIPQADQTCRPAPSKGQDTPRRRGAKAYRKPVLRRLGRLRSVAGSDPHLDVQFN